MKEVSGRQMKTSSEYGCLLGLVYRCFEVPVVRKLEVPVPAARNSLKSPDVWRYGCLGLMVRALVTVRHYLEKKDLGV